MHAGSALRGKDPNSRRGVTVFLTAPIATIRLLSASKRNPFEELVALMPALRGIAAPAGRDTRPTSDRVRENAFNLIGPVDGADAVSYTHLTLPTICSV